MDKVLNAIKCHHCQETLKCPILLPCAHSMCKQHADEAGQQVKCPKCGVWHQNHKFVINTELQEMIDSQIASFDFGPCHKEAKEACHKLEDILDQVDSILKNPKNISYQAIDELKNQVLLKSEQLKLEIDENTDKLLTLLSEYQKECELNLKESNFEPSLKNLENMKKESEKMLKESLDFLNRLKVDDGKWGSIKQTCERSVVDLNKQLEYFKQMILTSEFEEKKDQVEFFINVGISPLFLPRIRITDSAILKELQSLILNDNQKTELLEMCKISSQTKWTLLWRGSRDGFGANDFHSRCDNSPYTLTIIESTDGCIFGGYTEQTWNGAPGFVRDPNAFIFSLVNYVGNSFVMKIKNPDRAILRNKSFGPIFGNGCDIYIKNNSDTAADNHTRIKSYCPPDEFKECTHILSGTKTFKVKEIEVFLVSPIILLN